MNYRALMVCAVFGAIAPYAIAEVYSCGQGCYTSNPKHGSGKADLGKKIGSYTAAQSSHSSNSNTAAAVARPSTTVARSSVSGAVSARAVPVASASVAPRLDTTRASGRRTILEQELSNERTALANAQKALAEGRAVDGQLDAGHQNRIRQLESAVLDRQQNIQALQRELGRM
ncbi:MAG: hypothetical protein Q4B82_02620 [Alysiella sp.]|uniref:hypothetical protein n=1 Tax=Alysiella sp. TaxID=1872483 RepID=UPI0026DBBD8D|nr:hypothetical protein [Alysiella sp.]MDO4433459.1 hypothetical protein [Alysiella sp.]